MKTLKRIAKETAYQIRKAQLPLVASSLAYITILSIIPLLALSIAILQAFGGLEKLYLTLEPLIISYLAEGVSDQVIHTIRGFIQNAHAGTLGITGVIGLILTSMSMLWNAELAINRIWDAPVKRGWFQRVSSYWVFITLGPLALAVALGIATSQSLPIARVFPGNAAIFPIEFIFLFCVYKWVPHTFVRSAYAWVSALVTALVFTAVRTGYQAYLSQAVSYNKIYGSLAAIPILLLWIYLVWLVVLGGAALTAALQRSGQLSNPVEALPSSATLEKRGLYEKKLKE